MNRRIKCPASGDKLGFDKNNTIDDISLPAQRQRLLSWLRVKPITTIEARHELNILAPAARIFDLRYSHQLNILTFWDHGFTPEGKKHRIAKYVLLSGEFQGVGHE